MRKYIYIILLSLFALNGCKKDPSYTQKQISAFFTLSGNFQAYSNGTVILAVVSFQTHYKMPQIPSEEDFEIHGECTFSDSYYAIPDQGYVSCYYALSDNADEIFFYYKGGANNRKLMRSYKMTILDTDNIHLTDGGRVLEFERIN